MRSVIAGVVFMAAMGVVAACADVVDETRNQVTGTIELPAGATLPPHGSVRIEIYDTGSPDVSSTVFARQDLSTDDVTAPVAFALDYDPGKFTDRRDFYLFARVIDEAGRLGFSPFSPALVISNGAPTRGVTIELVARDR